MKDVLSICIPTYNRAVYLDRLLLSVSKNNHLERVNVCISDNASDDNTSEVVEEWRSKALFRIIYHRNTSNIGADRNYFSCIDISETDYCWLMGSDDQITPDAIECILPELPFFDIALVQSKPLQDNDNNYTAYPHIFNHASIDKTTIWALSSNEDVANYFRQCQDLRGAFSYLSSIIFNKASVDPVFDSRLDGSLYSHVKPFIQRMVVSPCRLAYIPKDLVVNQRGNDAFLTTWVQRTLIDFKGYLLVADRLQIHHSVSQQLISVLNRDHPPYKTFLIYSFTVIHSLNKDISLLYCMSLIPGRLFVVDIGAYLLSFPLRAMYTLYKMLSR